MPRLKKIQPAWSELRPLVMKLLGSKCKSPNCKWFDVNTQTYGCRDLSILHIDHILGDGNVDRIRYNNVYKHIYNLINNQGIEYVMRYYQLLCPNCNSIKKVINKEVRGKAGEVPTLDKINERGKNIPNFTPLSQSRELEEIKNTPGLLGEAYRATVKLGNIKEDK